MNVQLDKLSSIPLYQQLVEQIRQLIRSGALLPGDRLPPERKLAQQLAVNRTTILNAYRELKAEGFVTSHVGQGTVVSDTGEAARLPGATHKEPEWSHFFSAYGNRIRDDSLGELLNIANREDVISFAAGIANYDAGPLADMRDIIDQLLDRQARQSLMLSPVEGFYSLRAAVANYMADRGCAVRPDEILILSGSQQGIDLTARILLDPGDVVVVEEPTYFPAIQIFRALGARVIGVPMDEHGMRMDILEELFHRHRPKFIYTMPSFHNPTGYELHDLRRQKLVDLAQQYKVLVLEDDAYGSFYYDRPAKAPLKSLDQAGYVLYLSTFTKMIYPGIRVGWLAASPALIRRLSSARQTEDLHTNSLAQRIVEQLLTSGKLALHMECIRAVYRKRRDVMLEALKVFSPAGMTWIQPHGGYYIWCMLPEGVFARPLLALAAQEGVAFVPGSQFFPGEGGAQWLRLTFTCAPEEQIRPGIEILCQCVRKLQKIQSDKQKHPITEINPVL